MVYVLLADGFEEVETITPIDILRRADVEVVTVSIKERYVVGAHNITVKADKVISEIDNTNDMEFLILPGGAGHELLDKSQDVHRLIDIAHSNGIYIGAICAAPSILGKKKLLEGKRAVCFPGFEKYLRGAKLQSDKVVVDGKFVTAKGAGAAAEFGFAICEILKGKDVADKLSATMQYI